MRLLSPWKLEGQRVVDAELNLEQFLVFLGQQPGLVDFGGWQVPQLRYPRPYVIALQVVVLPSCMALSSATVLQSKGYIDIFYLTR